MEGAEACAHVMCTVGAGRVLNAGLRAHRHRTHQLTAAGFWRLEKWGAKGGKREKNGGQWGAKGRKMGGNGGQKGEKWGAKGRKMGGNGGQKGEKWGAMGGKFINKHPHEPPWR